MVQYRLGYFATSLCGHDKGRLYMIVDEVEDRVGLCDGIHRCLDNPKMKKKKHVQMIRSVETARLFDQMIAKPDADRWIKDMVRARSKEIWCK
jgi:ribosomal protein L14E/L6E/L27E